MAFGFESWAEFVVFFTSLLVGNTMVIGVNAVNSAPDFMLNYYQYIDGSQDAKAKDPSFWRNVLTFYTVVTLVAQTCHEPTNLTPFLCRFSLLFRLMAATVFMLVELLVIILMPHTGATEYGAIAGLMIVAYIGGVGRAYYENTGYAMFGPCPSKMLSGMLVGSAFSGGLMSIIQIILKASMPNDYSSVLMQSVLYFTMSIAIIVFTTVFVISLLFNPFAKKYIAEFRSKRSVWKNVYRPLSKRPHNAATGSEADALAVRGSDRDDDDEDSSEDESPYTVDGPLGEGKEGVVAVEPAFGSEDDRITREVEGASLSSAEMTKAHAGDPTHKRKRGVTVTKEGQLPQHPQALSAVECGHGLSRWNDVDMGEDEDRQLTTSELIQGVNLWSVIKRIWPMMLSCLLIFGITYLMYPGMLVAVDPSDGWFTTLIMTVYNFGDFSGRVTSMYKRIWPPQRVVLIASICRLAFVPLLILCAAGKIRSHVAAYIFTGFLAFSNGFFGTLSMVFASNMSTLTNDGERALAGQATGVCLLLGCSLGSLIQLAEVLPFNK